MWFEAQMVTAMAAQFNLQREQILAHLDTSRIGTKGYTRKDWLEDLLDWAAAAESFEEAIKPIVHATLLQAGLDATQALGIEAGQFDPFTAAITEYFQDRSRKIANDVNDETAKQLRASLSEGVLAGDGSFELRARVENVMGHASTVRADRIARTEITRAQTYGDLQAWKQSGVVEAKEWRTARDERQCPFCRALDGRIISLGETYFDKGDVQTVEGKDKDGNPKTFTQKISYDDMPGPPAHVNCRCVLLPVRA
jgi:SPP1 gp7 family putative phage head morphogenesis protein